MEFGARARYRRGVNFARTYCHRFHINFVCEIWLNGKQQSSDLLRIGTFSNCSTRILLISKQYNCQYNIICPLIYIII